MEMEMKELTKNWGEGAVKVVIRTCKKRRKTYEWFLLDFIQNYADDEFSDYLSELCEKYHIPMDDEDNEGW